MSSRTQRIAALNDQLRTTFLTGRVVLTEGIASLPDHVRLRVETEVKAFAAFTPDNDPYGQHDFGSLDLPYLDRIFWKIDYYDASYEYHSDDATDPNQTRRVLTIMLASEY